jgi:hypothetical protein
MVKVFKKSLSNYAQMVLKWYQMVLFYTFRFSLKSINKKAERLRIKHIRQTFLRDLFLYVSY